MTSTVRAVSAAMRCLNVALEAGSHDRATIDQAMVVLNAAVENQASIARKALHRFEAELVD